MMRLKIFLLLVSFALVGAMNVPETNSKRCYESSFCRRTRGKVTPFEVVVQSEVNTNNGLEIDVKNNKTGVLLRLKLDCLEDNTFRFEIDEKTPIKQRFRLKNEAIVEEIKKRPANVTNGDKNQLIVTCDSNRAIIHPAPFKIEFFRGDDLALTINNRQFMTFEHLRTKTSDDEEDPDAWEETYDGYTDSKPNGPEAIALDFTFASSEILYGIPEHHDTFALKRTLYGEPYRVFTTDQTFYELDSRMPNYGAIPVIYGHTSNGSAAGIFWHNTADTYVDIYDSATTHFMSEGGIIDVFVFLGPAPLDAFRQYTKITGVATLPQLFTLAYHQCRWSYMSQAEVLEIVANFDKYDIPLDTMWLDIDYADGKRYFTWNKETFPAPLKMMATLNATGRHLVFIIDPHIKVDDEYFFYKGLRDRGLFVKQRDNVTDFTGSCWPGNSSYVDFYNPDARKYYADQYLIENFKDSVVDGGVWNDMNEPVVFDAPEKTFPRDAVHINGVERWEHRHVHNMYALLQTASTFDGLMRRGEGKLRPFILTRAFFAGSQRYTAVWTGDNTADWGFLHGAIQACLAISVAGISFCGADIGGFFGNPDEELFYRWTQAAAYTPFFRNHASAGTEYREPYRFSNETRELATEAIKKRYTFLPFWYTLFYEHEMTGLPVMRPMLAGYPRDKNVFAMDTQYMLSDKLLVAPVLEPKTSWVIVRFPSIDGGEEGELWYDIDDYTMYSHVGTQAIEVKASKQPVFQRGGTVIVRRMTPRKASIYMRSDPITVFVAVDKNKRAEGSAYFDDERSYAYKNGAYKLMTFAFENVTLTVTEKRSMIAEIDDIAVERVYFAGVSVPKTVTRICNGDNVELSVTRLSEEYFYVDDLLVCKSGMSLILNGTAKNFVSATVLMAIAAFHFIKKFIFSP